MQKLLLILTVALWSLLTSSPVIAEQSTKGQLPELCPKTIDFALIPDGIGTSSHNINRDILLALERETGCRFRVIELPFARATEELKAGTVQMSGRFFETPERQQYLWFAHYQKTKTYAVSRSDLGKIGDLALLAKDNLTNFGVVRGFVHGEKIDDMLSAVRTKSPQRMTEFRDRDIMFEALLANRVQVIFLPSSIVYAMSRRENLPEGTLIIHDPDPSVEGRPGGLVMSKASFTVEQVKFWQNTLQKICENGTVLEIFRAYFPATASDVSCVMR